MGEKSDKKSVIITGFPYAFPYYFRVFEYLDSKDNFVFILPKLWLAKAGKVRIKLNPRPGLDIRGLRAWSYGGHGLGGLFKGWLPGLIFLLPYLKVRHGSRVLYSCSEPSLLTTLYNGIIAKLCGFKHVLFTWQNVEPEKYMSGLKLKIYKTIVRLNLKLAHGIICGNKKAQQIIIKFNKNIRTTVCPIAGVDTEKFKPGIISDWREKLAIMPEEKLILFYGALDKRKGLNVLIDAFKILIYNLKPVTYNLVIVGTGPESDHLKLLTTNYSLQTKVIFLDWLPNDQLPALLNAADVFVYPSVPTKGWEEQFGYAMAEASACGVPVVATRTGSIDEVVCHNESGILVESNNPDQLADALTQVLSDNNFRKKMGGLSREYVVKSFGQPVIADKIFSFLRQFMI